MTRIVTHAASIRAWLDPSQGRNLRFGRKIPMMQKLLDNPFLLLFIGVMVPMVVYVLWGVIDILTIPVAK